jgi:hypothetical protein
MESLAKFRKCGVRVDLRAAGPGVGDAAVDVERAQRDDQGGDLAVPDQDAVEQPAHRADAQAGQQRDDHRQARVVAHHGGHGERADAEHRADRQVDVAGDHHDRLPGRHHRQDRGVEQVVADALAGQEPRVVHRGVDDQGGQRQHDAELAGLQQALHAPTG